MNFEYLMSALLLGAIILIAQQWLWREYGRLPSIRRGVFDFCFALAALVAVAPALVGIAVAVKATSRGPVLHLSERVGRDGRAFRLITFRSVYVERGFVDGVYLSGFESAERVTPVGRVIRRYGLDELPRVVNALRGDIRMAGPRGRVPREV
ncbi:sugar transferase [Nocardia sp. NPDC051030]|uniref:sugar transferase n=1 Tax=Nocardia sp. NPDC051030 TaxID=3155162 RepID=UPI0034147BC9